MIRRSRRLRILTIVYEKEVSLLILQASSLRRFLPLSEIDEIVVVWNGRPMSTSAWSNFQSILAVHYGPLAPKVHYVVDADPSHEGLPPYVVQQLLKLEHAARHLDTITTVLDAKNVAIRPISWRTFFLDSSKPLVFFEDFTGHVLQDAIARYAAFLGTPAPNRAFIPAVMTPYALDGQVCRDMINDVSRREGCGFSEAFASRIGLQSEFLLYAVYQHGLLGRFEDACVPSPRLSWTLWPDLYAGANALRSGLQAAAEEGVPFIGLHRRRLLQCSRAEQVVLNDFLWDLKLEPLAFSDLGEEHR